MTKTMPVVRYVPVITAASDGFTAYCTGRLVGQPEEDLVAAW